jgi:integrase
MRERITKSAIKRVELSRVDRQWFMTDSEVPGFCVRFRPSCEPVYCYRYRQGRGVVTMSLGGVSVMSPDEARERARNYKVMRLDGSDPRAERATMRERPTMRDLMDRHINEHCRVENKPSSNRETVRAWNSYVIPEIGNRYVDSISRSEIASMKSRLAARSKSAANAMISCLSKAFTLAEEWGHIPPNSNPCRRVGKFKLKERNPPIEMNDLDRLELAFIKHEAEAPGVVALCRVLLYTGARLSEIQFARLKQFKPELGIIELYDSKTGPDILQLSSDAIAVIEGVKRPKDSEWLIPGPCAGEPVRSPYNRWHAIRKDASLPTLRIHDLRHIFGSYAHRAGASQKQVAKLLRHKTLVVTARYTHGFDSERRKNADDAAAMISRRRVQAPKHPESA